MRKLVAVEFLSVDGVMQGLGSPDEDRDGGFNDGGWGASYGDVMHEVVDPAGLGGTSAYLFGRRTYEKLAAFSKEVGELARRWTGRGPCRCTES